MIDNLADQKRLRAGVRFVDEMVVSIIGKIDRNHYKKLAQNDSFITK